MENSRDSLEEIIQEIETIESDARLATQKLRSLKLMRLSETALKDSEAPIQLSVEPVSWSLKLLADQDEKRIPLLGELTIGRAQAADLTIDDVKVSRSHAKVILIDDKVQLMDLNSSNGTFVNRNSIHDPVWLEVGDMIRVGDTIIVLTRS